MTHRYNTNANHNGKHPKILPVEAEKGNSVNPIAEFVRGSKLLQVSPTSPIPADLPTLTGLETPPISLYGMCSLFFLHILTNFMHISHTLAESQKKSKHIL